MGFVGNWTAIEYATDADRYKAIGNSMAVPVMRWIGEGIEVVESIPIGENIMTYTKEQKQEVLEEIKASRTRHGRKKEESGTILLDNKSGI